MLNCGKYNGNLKTLQFTIKNKQITHENNLIYLY